VQDAGVLTTPGIFKIISGGMEYDFGVVISASHNPYYDNGVKVFDARRCKITTEDEKKIIQNFEQCYGRVQLSDQVHCVVARPEAALVYQNDTIAQFRSLFLDKFKVVLDCSHGAAYSVAPAIFRALGATVITIADQPNGTNINDGCGSLHPEELAHVVTARGADAGFAFDGDADRVIAVSRTGEIKDGDDILALLLDLPVYQDVHRVVGTLFTNQGFEEFLTKRGKTLIRTNVGEKYVAAQLELENLPLGGEKSGHIITRNYSATGDGIFVALKVLESIMLAHNWDMVTFHKFPQVMINVPVAHKPDLSQQPYAALIEEYERTINTGRIIVRYSGTEPLLRVMTEAPTQEQAHRCAHDLATALQKALEVA